MFSQNLSLNELLKFQNSSAEEINRKLEKKNWTLVSADNPTSDFLGKTIWAYKPDIEKGTASAWCILFHSDSTSNRILYNPTDGNMLTEIRKKLISQKEVRPIDSKPKTWPEYITEIDAFTDGEYVFLLQTYVQPGYGGIKIFRKEEYLKALENGRL
jgi:hypothetical protein